MEHLAAGKRMAGTLFRALVLSFLVTTVILLALAFVMVKVQPESSQIRLAVLAVYAAATLVGGWYAGRKAERRKFLWGLLNGLLYFVLLTLASGIASQGIRSEPAHFMVVLALCAAGGMLGGMVS